MKISKKNGYYRLEFETKTDKEYFYNLLDLVRKLEDAVGTVSLPSALKFRDTKKKSNGKKADR